MQAFENGHRFAINRSFETRLNQNYDYKRDGLLKRLISKNIYESKNPLTRNMLSFIETSLIFMLKSVDKLHYWKKFTLHNR